MNQAVVSSNAAAGTARLVYLLYLTGLLFGITGIVGVVTAYLNQNDAPDWLRSHYRFQIRTFWIGALCLFVGFLLAMILIGYLVLLFWAVWLIVRCVKGMKYLERGEAHPDPTGWMFS